VPARWRLAVCKGKDCRKGRSDDLFRTARAEAARLGIGPDRCDLERGGCYGLCELGPNLVLREASIGSPDDPLWAGHFRLLHVPGEFHYWRMDADKLRRVLAEHVAGGRPAPDLLCPRDKQVKDG
jgi:(2Fe-2S) ferredoxin